MTSTEQNGPRVASFFPLRVAVARHAVSTLDRVIDGRGDDH
jgi:hypothetical protein